MGNLVIKIINSVYRLFQTWESTRRLRAYVIWRGEWRGRLGGGKKVEDDKGFEQINLKVFYFYFKF